MPQDHEKPRLNNGGEEMGTELIHTASVRYGHHSGSHDVDPHYEDTQLLPVGTGIHRSVSANAVPGIDAIKELQKLTFISGITIRTFSDKQPTSPDKQPNQITVNLEEYIHPEDLLKDVDGIKPWQLEITLLQLQWQNDEMLRARKQLTKEQVTQTVKVLNNLGCVSALLGRYQNASYYLEKAIGLALAKAAEKALAKAAEKALDEAAKLALDEAEKALDEAAKLALDKPATLALLANYIQIKKVADVIKQQDYWGKIGGSQ